MYAVILAGGSGTRLWPFSRRDNPKPFLPLVGEQTLLQQTAARIRPLIPPDDSYVIADARHVPLVREQLPELPPANVVGEPVGRNTAAAVALAATLLDRRFEDVMVVLPADHFVADEGGFRDAVQTAAHGAGSGLYVTLGIRPTHPETGYGYIVAADGEQPDSARQVLRVERFVEKPPRPEAERLIANGGAYWNGGYMIARRDALIGGLRTHAEDILAPIVAGVSEGRDLSTFYPSLRATSFDYALLEPASAEGRVATVPLDVGWTDLGSWSAILDLLLASDGRADGGVVREGRSVDIGSRELLVRSAAGRLVVTIGLEGAIVVDTPDAVLVCARDRAQDVKTVLDRLAAAGETQYL
jgi:mannose-1-phosphate guanylyltransferase